MPIYRAEVGSRGHLTVRRRVDLPSSGVSGGEGDISIIQQLDERRCASRTKKKEEMNQN